MQLREFNLEVNNSIKNNNIIFFKKKIQKTGLEILNFLIKLNYVLFYRPNRCCGFDSSFIDRFQRSSIRYFGY